MMKVLKLKMQKTPMGEFQLPCFSAGRILMHGLAKNRSVGRAFATALAQSNPPWTLLIGCDECWAGNNLAQSGRKTQVVSFSFRQLGAVALSKSCNWFPAWVIRSTFQGRLAGGLSALCAQYVEDALFDDATGLATAGVPVDLGEGRMSMLTVDAVQFLADGEGNRQVFQAKGAGGLRPCLRCVNAWMLDSGVVDPDHHEIDVSDVRAFQAHTGIHDHIDSVVAKATRPAEEGMHQDAIA